MMLVECWESEGHVRSNQDREGGKLLVLGRRVRLVAVAVCATRTGRPLAILQLSGRSIQLGMASTSATR